MSRSDSQSRRSLGVRGLFSRYRRAICGWFRRWIRNDDLTSLILINLQRWVVLVAAIKIRLLIVLLTRIRTIDPYPKSTHSNQELGMWESYKMRQPANWRKLSTNRRQTPTNWSPMPKPSPLSHTAWWTHRRQISTLGWSISNTSRSTLLKTRQSRSPIDKMTNRSFHLNLSRRKCSPIGKIWLFYIENSTRKLEQNQMNHLVEITTWVSMRGEGTSSEAAVLKTTVVSVLQRTYDQVLLSENCERYMSQQNYINKL